MDWWDETGPCRLLHRFNPLRLGYISEHVALDKKKLLDVGCGGGLLTEPLANLGAKVTGIDISLENVSVARKHAKLSGLDIEYINTTIESMPGRNKFDIVTALEVIEHVEDPEIFVENISKRIKSGGIFFLSTINRTLLSLLLAKYTAEYILQLLPKGTHDWRKFIKPSEINDMLSRNNLTLQDLRGISYNPMSKIFSFTNNIQNNYILIAKKV